MCFVIHEYTEVTISSKGWHIHRTTNIGIDPSQVLSSSFMTSLEWATHHFAMNASLAIKSSCIIRDIIQSIHKPLLDHDLQHILPGMAKPFVKEVKGRDYHNSSSGIRSRRWV